MSMTIPLHTPRPPATRARPLRAVLLAIALSQLIACATRPATDPADAIEWGQGLPRVELPQIRFEPISAEFADATVGRIEQWHQPLAAGGEVFIDNPFGDVYVRHNRGGDEVGISGTVQRLGQDPRIESIDLRADPHRVALSVRYPDDGREHPSHPYGRVGRVDVSVLIPEGATLHIRTRDGNASGKRVRANVIAESDSGNISFSTTGWIRARTRSGRVEAVFAGDSWQQPSRVDSQTGAVSIEWRATAAVELRGRGGSERIADPAALADRLRGDTADWHARWGAPNAVPSRIEVSAGSGPVRLAVFGTQAEFDAADAAHAGAGSRRR